MTLWFPGPRLMSTELKVHLWRAIIIQKIQKLVSQFIEKYGTHQQWKCPTYMNNTP
jgi:hypothetical protein